MLVNCPRCGFSQPQDKYCAQCGVDTETYKPPQRSSLSKTFSNPLLYLGIAIVASFIFFKAYYNHDSGDIAQRVQFLKGSLQIAKKTGQEKPAEVPEPPKAMVAEEERAPASQAAAAGTTAAAVADGTAVAGAAAAPGTVSAAAPAPAGVAPKPAVPTGDGPSVFIYYTEVPRRALEKIYEESQATGQFNFFGDYTAGILPDVEKRIRSEALKIHLHEKTQHYIGEPQPWFTGIHDPEVDEQIGLSTFIELADSENGVFRGNLQVIRSWREAGESGVGSSVQKSSYPAIFELNPGAGFFIAGVLPRKSNLPHEEELTRKGAFQILNSVPFKNKESEFVIFIEFRKKP